MIISGVVFYDNNTCDGEKFTIELRKSSYFGQNRNDNSNNDDVTVINNNVKKSYNRIAEELVSWIVASRTLVGRVPSCVEDQQRGSWPTSCGKVKVEQSFKESESKKK